MMTVNIAKGADEHTKIYVAHGIDRFNAVGDPGEEEEGYAGGNEMAFYPDSVFIMVQKPHHLPGQEEIVTIKHRFFDTGLDDISLFHLLETP